MAKRYPKRKLSTEDISRALNFDSDSDDSNDKLEKLLGEDSGSDIEFLKSCTTRFMSQNRLSRKFLNPFENRVPSRFVYREVMYREVLLYCKCKN